MNESPRSPAPLTRKRRRELDYTFKFLTPMFGGGADPKTEEGDPISTIRGTSLRGQLRFWWRATQGLRFATLQEMHEAEGQIFGSASQAGNRTGPSVRSLGVRLDVSKLSCSSKSPQRVPYFDFPLRDAEGGKDPRKVAFLTGSFVLHLRFPLGVADDIVKQVQAAVWALSCFGGLGGRTRRGFGALQLQDGDLGSLRPSLKSKWIVQVGEGPPKGVPVLSPRSRASLKVIGDQTDATSAWRWLAKKLKTFRQGEKLGRNPANGPNPRKLGRSRWPEADFIRHDLLGHYQGSPRHEERQIHCSKAPRAAFGMPIIFHFKDHGEPSDVTLKPKGFERYASPLILRPAATSKETWAAVLILGNRPELDRDLPVVMEQAKQEFDVKTHLAPSDERWNNSPLAGLGSDPLLAFMKFCQD